MVTVCCTDEVDECLLCCWSEVGDGCCLIIRDVENAAEVTVYGIAGTEDLVGWETETGGLAFDEEFGDADGGGE